MIPRFFVEMESFPLNANGKIDRKAIQPPQAASFKEEYAAPENETQKKLCSAFERILHCGTVGINDDFFALGGDSLLAMNLQTESGLTKFSTEMIFSGKTPKRMAELVMAASDNEGTAVQKLNEYPLNPFEHGFTFCQQPECLYFNHFERQKQQQDPQNSRYVCTYTAALYEL